MDCKSLQIWDLSNALCVPHQLWASGESQSLTENVIKVKDFIKITWESEHVHAIFSVVICHGVSWKNCQLRKAKHTMGFRLVMLTNFPWHDQIKGIGLIQNTTNRQSFNAILHLTHSTIENRTVYLEAYTFWSAQTNKWSKSRDEEISSHAFDRILGN